jgi:hypothetical protein
LPKGDGETRRQTKYEQSGKRASHVLTIHPDHLLNSAALARSLKHRPKAADSLTVERRLDHRRVIDMDVYVTRLTHPTWSGNGQVADISNTGVCIKAPFELAAGDIVRLEVADSNLFGFVVHASREGDAFRAGIEIQRVLIGGTDLSKVLQMALRQALPGVPGVFVS